jgi:aryl-alcohol dehydrogenase-like predicted oxidoreductase
VSKERGIKAAQVAFAWLLSVPGITAPIIGATKVDYIDDAVAALDVKLSEEEISRLEAPYTPHAILGHDQPTVRPK